MSRFKSINLYHTKPKIKLLLQKIAKSFGAGSKALVASGGSAPIPLKAALPLQTSGYKPGK